MKKIKKFFWITIVIVFVFVLLAIIINSSTSDPESLDLVSELKKEKQYSLPEGNNYWLGSDNPKVTIVEFADFSCSACKSTSPKLRKIIFSYSRDVKIIFRDFPVISEDSLTLAMAGRCAGEQGLFWLMHDKLFEEQGKIDNSKLTSLTKEIGGDAEELTYCLKNQKYLDDIQKDFSLGEKLGVSGTPTLFINGYKVPGDLPEEALIRIVEGFLK